MVFSRQSTSTPRSKDLNLEALESKRSTDLPPPYPIPIPDIKSESIVPRINHLYVSEKCKPIIGAWTVDPLLAIPAVVLETLPSGDKLRNLDVYSRHKSVTAHLNLASDSPCTSSLAVRSKHGEVNVIIVSLPLRFFSTSNPSPSADANKPTIPFIC